MSGPIAWYHERYVHGRRVDVLAQHFAQLIDREKIKVTVIQPTNRSIIR